VTVWTVAPDHTRLLADGEPTFLLADTVWAAFGRPSMPEWDAYLHRRRRQGFNAVNISVLPVAHDSSSSPADRQPFELATDGSWRLDRPSAAYFENAASMCAAAVAAGLTPVLVVLWCNYVPGSWGARRTPELVFSPADRDRYVRLVADTFAGYDPIFVLSGDDGFDDDASIQAYVSALRLLRERAPDCLLTAHSNPSAVLPAALAEATDFYAFQSGHGGDSWDSRAWQLAEHYLNAAVRRPIVDLEPCYEGHGVDGGTRRYTAAQVRQASWTAVLAGAGAGLGYAAHGVWSWHHAGDAFNGEHFSGTPFEASLALQFRGAGQVGTLRRIVERFGLYDLRSRQDLLVDDRSGVRLGATADSRTLVAFLPHPFTVRLGQDWSDAQVSCWNLAADRPDHVTVTRAGEGHGDAVERSVIGQPEFLGDALVILRR